MDDSAEYTTVYKISSNTQDHVYIGYCRGEQVLDEFLKGAKRTFSDTVTRGAALWFNNNNDDEDNIKVEILEVCDSEFEGWCLRNEFRSSDPDSITGPSQWPMNLSKQAKETCPDRIERWKANNTINTVNTAREAMRLGAFTYDTMKSLGSQHGRDCVKFDMDNLNARQFSKKYNVPIHYKNK